MVPGSIPNLDHRNFHEIKSCYALSKCKLVPVRTVSLCAVAVVVSSAMCKLSTEVQWLMLYCLEPLPTFNKIYCIVLYSDQRLPLHFCHHKD